MAFLDRFASGGRVMVDGDINYATGRGGARWFVTNPTVNTSVLGQTSFSSTTPFLILDTADAVTTPGSVSPGTRIIPSTLTLTQTGTVAGGAINVLFAVDSKNRFSAVGNAGSSLPKQTAMELAGTSGVTPYVIPTANAASANIRYFQHCQIAAALGTTTVINIGDGYSAGKASSFLVFVWAATTGPSLLYTMEWIEERAAQV